MCLVCDWDCVYVLCMIMSCAMCVRCVMWWNYRVRSVAYIEQTLPDCIKSTKVMEWLFLWVFPPSPCVFPLSSCVAWHCIKMHHTTHLIYTYKCLLGLMYAAQNQGGNRLVWSYYRTVVFGSSPVPTHSIVSLFVVTVLDERQLAEESAANIFVISTWIAFSKR